MFPRKAQSSSPLLAPFWPSHRRSNIGGKYTLHVHDLMAQVWNQSCYLWVTPAGVVGMFVSLEPNPMLLLRKQLFSFSNQAPSLFPSLWALWRPIWQTSAHLTDLIRAAWRHFSNCLFLRQHWAGVLLPLSLELNPRWKPVTFCGCSLKANAWSHCLSWRCQLWGMTKFVFCFKPPSGIWCTTSF